MGTGFEASLPSPSGFALFREVTTTPFSFALAVTGRAGFVVAGGFGTGGDAVGFTKLGIGGWDEDAALAATALCQEISAIRCKRGGEQRERLKPNYMHALWVGALSCMSTPSSKW